ncbi:hypothetical protein N7539_002985 [Penicillium diatomitis]|uniref:Zn(2)-C6 fungal-type domain-containing protein n=1 Tax=Penicillium diatomitis TaxID=2819901 RepID=A0A9W9XGC8_9EURO|nr:uncharacterized protein N7539_002985 [Penicillium diatomitis]KAJ5491418.1 hypothetical protein N7539_002985 [Penicillium diatomitis]
MPNTAAPKSVQHSTLDHASTEKGYSPGDYSSGVESENELDGSSAVRTLKRKRPLTVSCELCKQRKVKCDRVQPSCGWCTRNGQLCEYRERKKPGLRAGYGKELEQRLDKLEEVIQAQARLIETHILQGRASRSHGQPCVASVCYNSPPELSGVPGPSPRTGGYCNDASPGNLPHHRADATIATPSESSRRALNYNGVGSRGSVPSLGSLPPASNAQMNNDYTGNESSLKVPVSLFGNQEQSLADPDLDLPPYDLLYALVDLYFEHINTWCPILHRRSTLDTFFGPSPLQEADRMVLYAIVATTLRFSTDSRLTDRNRKRYHDSSKQKVLLYGLESSSVKALQALVILAIDLVGSSNGPPGWKLLALITRSVVRLGLAVEAKSALIAPVYPSIYTLRAVTLPESESWIEDESRRRLFWMVYLLDRYSTIATAFDFALDDKDIDRKLPCKEEFFLKNQPVETRRFRSTNDRVDHHNHAENVGSFGLYMEILGILTRIHVFLKKPVDIGSLSDVEDWQATYRRLDSELTSWEFNLPFEYTYENASRVFAGGKQNRSLHSEWVQLHATYQTAVIRLHSSAAYPTTRSPIFTPSYSASQRCLLAVDNILSVTKIVVENNLLNKLGPPFAFSLWVSARLILVHGSTIAHTVSRDILFFVDTLSQMGQHWKVAERYSNILQRVLDEYSEYQQSGATDGERTTPSTVKILADMRRCAFDLDFLISRQPRESPSSVSNDLRRPSLAAITPRNPAPNELEYLDVFGFFNFPRVPPTCVPDTATDGANANHLSMSETVPNPMSIHGLTGNGSMMDGNGSVNANEFNITNYLIPTPETDWLFRPGG